MTGGFGSGGGFRGEYEEPLVGRHEQQLSYNSLPHRNSASRLQDFMGNMVEPDARPLTAGGGSGTGAHPFFDKLHSLGMAPRSYEEDNVEVSPTAIFRDLMLAASKKTAADSKKKLKVYATAKEFWTDVFDSKVWFYSARDDPQVHAAYDFHLKSMLYLDVKRGWAIAAAYNTKVMKGCKENYIDLVRLSQQPQALIGNIEPALDQPSLQAARQDVTDALTGQGSGGASSTKGGDMTWCPSCVKNFPKSANHAPKECFQAAKTKYLKKP
jgi:hypothetical protein